MKLVFSFLFLILIVSLANANAFCGDGILDEGEECDSTPCCNSTCTLIIESIPCDTDGKACSLETCNINGECVD